MDLPPVPMDPRPTLDVVNLTPSNRMASERRRRLKRILRKNEGSKVVTRILARYRRKQKVLLGGKTDEDPDPYDSDYVFYCLDKPCGY
jgi:hypothetical protein